MQNKNRKTKRQIRVRSKTKGTSNRPRLSVFRSNRFVYAQIIDDEKGRTLIGLSERHITDSKDNSIVTAKSRIERVKALGILLAKKAEEKKIKKVVFDRGSYVYHGVIKALADGAREGGLQF